MNEKMFCRQCEQTAMGKACTSSGVCGKNPETSALMDKIISELQGIAIYGNKLKEKGIVFDEIDKFVIEALFTTVTNVNFDPEKLKQVLKNGQQHLLKMKKEFIKLYPEYEISQLPEPAQTDYENLLSGIYDSSLKTGIFNGISEDIRSLKEVLLYGIKGMAAYAYHAWILGEIDEQVRSFFYKGLSAITDKNISFDILNRYFRP